MHYFGDYCEMKVYLSRTKDICSQQHGIGMRQSIEQEASARTLVAQKIELSTSSATAQLKQG